MSISRSIVLTLALLFLFPVSGMTFDRDLINEYMKKIDKDFLEFFLDDEEE